MPRISNEQREAVYQARYRRAKKLQLPSWWRELAPGRGIRFWLQVEMLRKEAGVPRYDYSGISYIVEQLKGVKHGHQ